MDPMGYVYLKKKSPWAFLTPAKAPFSLAWFSKSINAWPDTWETRKGHARPSGKKNDVKRDNVESIQNSYSNHLGCFENKFCKWCWNDLSISWLVTDPETDKTTADKTPTNESNWKIFTGSLYHLLSILKHSNIFRSWWFKKKHLVGGFSPTPLKHMRKSNWIISPGNTSQNKKCLSCHHLVYHEPPKTYIF